MTGYMFRAVWPILDEDLTISALVSQAEAELDLMVARSGGRITGKPRWKVDGALLHCVAPAEPIKVPEVMGGKPIPVAVEHEIYRLAAAGLANKEIAAQLAISPKTVWRYRNRVRRAA